MLCISWFCFTVFTVIVTNIIAFYLCCVLYNFGFIVKIQFILLFHFLRITADLLTFLSTFLSRVCLGYETLRTGVSK
jgi:hypothetical protein